LAHPKGTPKPPTSGRKKGTPNKRTVALETLKDKAKLDPLDFFRAVLENDAAVLGADVPDLDQRITAAKELAGYLYPKLKAVEVTGDVGPLAIKLKWPEEGEPSAPDPEP
jgi:hypothetical protein